MVAIRLPCTEKLQQDFVDIAAQFLVDERPHWKPCLRSMQMVIPYLVNKKKLMYHKDIVVGIQAAF